MGKRNNKSMSSTLIESFGYESQLDELSMQDVSDFGRGALSGATFGFDKNIAAGVNSLFKGSKYKDELQKQVQADREAEMRSPKAYGAGDIVGSIAAPIPGATALKGAMTAGKLAKMSNAGRMATSAAHQGIGAMTGKAASSALTANTLGDTDKIMKLQQEIGTTPDGKFGPKSKAKLKLWQQQNGIPPTGIPDEATMSAMDINESLSALTAKLKSKLATETNEGIGDKIIGWGAKAAKDALGKGSSGFGKAKPFIRDVPSNASVPATSAKAGEFIPKSNLPATAAQAAEKDAIDSTATGFNVAKVPPKEGDFIPGMKVPATAAQAAEKDAIDSTATGFGMAKTPPKEGDFIPGMKTAGKTANVDKNIADAEFREIEQKALADNRLSTVDKDAINKGGIKDWVSKNPKKARALGYLALFAASNLGGDDTTSGMPGKAAPSATEPDLSTADSTDKGMPPSAGHIDAMPAAPSAAAPATSEPTTPKSVQNAPKSSTPHTTAKPHVSAPKSSGNPEVRRWQAWLKQHGSPNLTVDGKYGPETQAAYDKAFPKFQRESKELDRIIQLSRR